MFVLTSAQHRWVGFVPGDGVSDVERWMKCVHVLTLQSTLDDGMCRSPRGVEDLPDTF